jgi:hypothetical protein
VTPRQLLVLVGALALATIAAAAFGWRMRPLGTGPLTRQAAIDSLALKELGGRHGVVFVFSPATCRLKARDFRMLNRLGHVPGLRVRGIVLVDAPKGTAVRHYTDPFDIRFPVALDSLSSWATALATSRIESPLLVFVRDGRVQAMLWSDASLSLRGLPFHWEEFAADSANL